MTRRARLERRLENRRDWAASRHAKADASFTAARQGIEHIPPGQPILVGHHSERHHRRDLERHDNRMRTGVEHANMAAHHESKAAGLAAQLDRAVFTDDADAIEQLEARIAANERTAELYVRVNAAWRRTRGTTPAERVASLVGVDLGGGHQVTPRLAQTIESTMRACTWLKTPFDTTNVRARIRTDRQRIEEVKRVGQLDARLLANLEAPDDWHERTLGRYRVDDDGALLVVEFTRKPSDAVREQLKKAWFRWHPASGLWWARWTATDLESLNRIECAAATALEWQS